jgi:hypothetical protein
VQGDASSVPPTGILIGANKNTFAKVDYHLKKRNAIVRCPLARLSSLWMPASRRIGSLVARAALPANMHGSPRACCAFSHNCKDFFCDRGPAPGRRPWRHRAPTLATCEMERLLPAQGRQAWCGNYAARAAQKRRSAGRRSNYLLASRHEVCAGRSGRSRAGRRLRD